MCEKYINNIQFLLYTITFLAFGINNNAYGQTAACPEIKFTTNNPINISCITDTCIRLKARLPNIRQTANSQNGYIVNSIPFSEAQPFSIPGANAIFVNEDDKYSNIIRLPFTFCYFGNNYNSVVIGANGAITFNTSMANNPSSYEQCDYNYNPLRIPRIDRNHPVNTIFAALHDIDPSENNNANKRIEWSISGQAPCRKMIINWVEISQFSCISNRSTFQCVLYENTNVIDVFVRQKPVCNIWNCGIATIGIQNSNATIAITPPNRNATSFNVTMANSEGWRFLPNGTSLLVNNQVSLYDANNNIIEQVTPTVIGSGLLEANFTTPICFNNTSKVSKYYVKANYIPCSGDSIRVIDSIIINYESKPNPPIVSTPINLCVNTPTTPLSANGTNLKWYTTATGGTGSPNPPTPNTNSIGVQTYNVSQTINNCESSRVPILVNIINNVQITLNENICEGDSFLFNGIVYKSNINGVKDTFITISGCDSIVTLQLNVVDTSEQTVNINLCENLLPYNWNGIVVNTFGNNIARYVTNNQNGCDSVTNLNLIALPTQIIHEYDTICNNQLPYTWNNIIVNQGGNNAARAVFTNQNGCDSVRILNLMIKDTLVVSLTQKMCSNQLPFTWNNQTVTTTGIHQLTHRSLGQNGCDSTTNLRLTINDSIIHNDNISICEDELPYTWNGMIVTQGGNNIARFVNTTTAGCDSINILNLIVKVKDTITISESICDNELPFLWNGFSINTGGNQVAQFIATGTDGCDSVTILNLTVYNRVNTIANINICNNTLPYTWNGITVNYAGQGIATFRTIAQNGCDSTVTLNLTLSDTIVNTEIITKCSNELPFIWNNITINNAGNNIARYITSAQNGCDSITILNVNINPTNTITVNDTICSNGLPYLWNGIMVNTGGNNAAKFTVNNQYGCDSITELNLHIIDTISIFENITICEAALPYTWNGQIIQQGGNNISNFRSKSVLDCDSITYLNLTVSPTIKTNESLQLCENQIPYNWNGIMLTSAGNNVATYRTTSSITNCDSIVTAHVSINDTNMISIDTLLCHEQYPFSWNGITISDAGTYTARLSNIANCDSTIRLNVRKRPLVYRDSLQHIEGCDTVFYNNRIYTSDTSWVDTLTSVAGCDSVYQTYKINVYKSYTDTINVRICIGDSYTYNGKTYYSSATSIEEFTSINGCDSTIILNVTVEDLPSLDIKLHQTKKLCVGDTILVEAFGAKSYIWDVNNQTYTGNPLEIITYFPETIIKLKGKSDIGCENEISYTIISELCCEIGIPNAFSPNNDGLNDVYQPLIPGNPEKYEMHIFDRWGNLVFSTIKKNDAWDGAVKGKLADPGVYFYIITITCRSGENVTKKGDITLIR